MTTMDGTTLKRAKLDDTVSDKVIGTHSGTFQADEAMGVWMLRQTRNYRNSKVVRTRDLKILDTLDIVLDVGGIYDHSKLRYDHHQRDYDERFDSGKNNAGRCTKLSASGLIYRHYGKEVIRTCYPSLSDTDLELAYNQLYDSLLEALDAIDTGVEQVPNGVSIVYKDTTGLSSRVSRLNPRWNEIDDATGQPPVPDERFEVASQMCGEDFLSVMTKIIESDLPARSFVEQALLARHDTDPSGEIIKFDSGGLPWKKYLYELEKEHSIDPVIKFVLYTDQAGMWRIQAVTVEGQQFENRLSLPEEWRGVRDQDLVTVTKIPGSRFCHAAGFIGGNDIYEGALAMAKEALKRKSQPQATPLSQPARGAFIVFEGVDRCGKTTQTDLLMKKLVSEGLAAVAMRFPDRTTTVGQLINQYLVGGQELDDQAVHLLFSANRWDSAPQLEHHLVEETATVVCDRYAYSGVAFTSAKPREKQGGPLSLEWCKGPDVGLPAPDAVIFLDLSPEEAEQRGGYGEERYEKKELQARVRQRFVELEQMDAQEGRVPWHVVSAAQSIEQVHAEIWSIVEKTLEQVNNGKDLGKLWQEGS